MATCGRSDARFGTVGLSGHIINTSDPLGKRYVPDDPDIAIKNDGGTSEHIGTFDRLGAYRAGAEEVRAEVRVQPQKPREAPKKKEKEEKKEKKPQTSLFDF